MPAALDRLPNSARVLVVRLRSLGDCVLTTPALHLLKQYRPDLRIAVMVEPRFAAIYAGNPDVETTLEPTYANALKWRATLALNLHGGTRSAMLTLASLARWRAGFAHYRFQSLYNIRIPRAQAVLGVERKVHTAEHVASAMFFLGVPIGEVPRAVLPGALNTVPLPPSLELRRASPRDRGSASDTYVVIHPFASAAHKAWPAARFVELARWLRDARALTPVVIGATSDDFAPFAEFECVRGAALTHVCELMRDASLFVGNDSGPAHIAAGYGVPVTVLYGSSDPIVWAPWRTRAEVIVEPRGLANVELAQVRNAVERLAADAV